MNDSDCSYVLYERLREYEGFSACLRGAYLKDVVGGEAKLGKDVGMDEIPKRQRRRKKKGEKKEKKQQRKDKE